MAKYRNPSSLLTLRNSQLSTVSPELLALSHSPQAADAQRLLNQEHLNSASPLSCWFMSGLVFYVHG